MSRVGAAAAGSRAPMALLDAGARAGGGALLTMYGSPGSTAMMTGGDAAAIGGDAAAGGAATGGRPLTDPVWRDSI